MRTRSRHPRCSRRLWATKSSRAAGSSRKTPSSCATWTSRSAATLAISIFLVVCAVALGWFLLPRREAPPEPTAGRRPNADIDYAELEEAEREVQEAPDEDSVRDWGPGTGTPPPV